jgi:hypothetical protein
MWKAVLAGTTSLMIAGSSLVYAQQPPGAPATAAPGATTAPSAAPAAGAPDKRESDWADHVKALAEARLANLKSELKLTPEQEKNWSALHIALQDLAKYYADQEAPPRPPAGAPGIAADAPKPADPATELRERADELVKFAGILKRLADAVGPFHSSLDESQKRRFAMYAPPILNEHLAMGEAGREDLAPDMDGPGIGPSLRGDLGIGPGMMDDDFGPGMGGPRMYGREMGPGMGGPGMGGPGMYGREMGPGMRGPGMGGPGMGGPGMGGPGMGGPGMGGPGMGGPGMMYGDEMGPGMRGPRMGGPGMMGPDRGFGGPMGGYGPQFGP